MYVRPKSVTKEGKTYTYLQIVESVRKGKRITQRVVASLGRLDELQSTGTLDRLAEHLGKYCTKVSVVNAFREGALSAVWSKTWGPVLIFRRLWEELGLPDLIHRLLKGRKLQFDAEAALFGLVLQRLLFPGSDLSGSFRLPKVFFPRFWELSLQHLYRAVDLLSLHREDFEWHLYERRRDLFSTEVDLVFFDTTTLFFEGEGPEGLAEYGHSKDNRPGDTQVVLCVAVDREGYPLSCEVWPGNAVDVDSVAKMVGILKKRFAVRRAVLVCDRGMMSAMNLRRLVKAGMDYIIGARMRSEKEVRKEVLSRAGRYRELEENLWVKEVRVGEKRYVVCLNPDEAERDRLAREAIVEKLREKLAAGGVKSLIGNRGFRTFLKMDGDAAGIDEAKIEGEGRYDGKWVVRTSTELSAEEVARTYKSLWMVEALFRVMKDVLEARPIYHRKANRVEGHVFACFLALFLGVTLKKKLEAEGRKVSWGTMMEGLKEIAAVKLRMNEKTYLLRTEVHGEAATVFRAVGVRPPPLVQEWEGPLSPGEGGM